MPPSSAALVSFVIAGITKTATALPFTDNHTTAIGGLKWRPCELDFPQEVQDVITDPIDCATLEVPQDYTRPDSQEKLTLQLIKHNATQEPFKGSIIFNPGGPGASGVEEVAKMGPIYRDVFDGHYNIIGFDARGTGKTLPFTCDVSKSNTTSGKIPSIQTNREGLPQIQVYDVLKNKAWEDGKFLADACANTEGLKDIASYMGTAFVARDMARIIDALNEDGKLRFWGRSYSTSLGQTFAAMFPDRVDRMILDSVQKISDYWAGTWSSSVRGTEYTVKHFFEECVSAGPELCPGIANFTGPETTAESLMAELNKAFQELVDDPVIVPDDSGIYALRHWQVGGLPLLLELKYYLLAQNYYPLQWPTLQKKILPILNRDWDSLTTPPPEGEGPPAEKWNEGTDQFHAISCGDGALRASSPEDMYTLTQAQQNEGSFADAFFPQVWVCAHWPFEAAERYEGNFNSVNTSFPLLFVNSQWDPITPIEGAYETAAGFHGSRLLVHKGHGHGLMNHPSSCTMKAIRDYMIDGTMPEVGAECEPDEGGFDYLVRLLAEVEQAQKGTKRSLSDPATLVQNAIEKAKKKDEKYH